MHLLIAPNAFKHSLTADAAAEAIKSGFLSGNLKCTCECFPIGDGGDGTAELIIKQLEGEIIYYEVSNPLGIRILSSIGLIDSGRTAVIEMAGASGIRLLKKEELNPLQATSYGTGEQIRQALGMGVSKIIIAMGGSATVDCGTGILRALGIRFLDVFGDELIHPESFTSLDKIDVSLIDSRILDSEVIILCDVDNLLLGDQGSAAVFGPQKGATAEGVKKLDASLRRFAEITKLQTGKDISDIKYGGTAGGAAAGLFAWLNAKLVNGIDYYLELTGFDQALGKSDLVITGEGSIDEQTLQGKGPMGVAERAKRKGIPVIALAGRVPKDINANLHQYFDVLLAIGNEPNDLQMAMSGTAANLARTSTELSNLMAL